MSTHKNIVVRWQEAKEAHRMELARLSEAGRLIGKDIAAQCGQSVCRIDWESGGIKYNVGYCGDCCYAGSNASQYGNHEISMAKAATENWNLKIGDLEARVSYLRTVTTEQLRVMAEALL